MYRQEFLDSLNSILCRYPRNEVDKCLEYYNECISDRIENGMSEEEAVADLGDICNIADNFKMDMPITTLVKHKLQGNRNYNDDSSSVNGGFYGNDANNFGNGPDNNGSGKPGNYTNADYYQGNNSSGYYYNQENNTGRENKQKKHRSPLSVILMIFAFPFIIAFWAIVAAVLITLWSLVFAVFCTAIALGVCAVACIIAGIFSIIEINGLSFFLYIGAALICFSLTIIFGLLTKLVFKGIKAATSGIIKGIKRMLIVKGA